MTIFIPVSYKNWFVSENLLQLSNSTLLFSNTARVCLSVPDVTFVVAWLMVQVNLGKLCSVPFRHGVFFLFCNEVLAELYTKYSNGKLRYYINHYNKKGLEAETSFMAFGNWHDIHASLVASY